MVGSSLLPPAPHEVRAGKSSLVSLHDLKVTASAAKVKATLPNPLQAQFHGVQFDDAVAAQV